MSYEKTNWKDGTVTKEAHVVIDGEEYPVIPATVTGGTPLNPTNLNKIENQLAALTNMIYPVGSIYMSVNNTNPSTLFGGTWVAWGAGKVPVGVDTSQTEFNTVEKTGGEKTHQLTLKELPGDVVGGGTSKKTWAVANWGDYSSSAYVVTTVNDAGNTVTGGVNSQSHNNLQPYITCYMWKRTD